MVSSEALKCVDIEAVKEPYLLAFEVLEDVEAVVHHIKYCVPLQKILAGKVLDQ